MWHERVKCRLGGSNPTFLAAEGSSTRPRILGAICRSASGGKGVPDQFSVKMQIKTHNLILFIYDISEYLLSQELNYLGQVLSWSFALGRAHILEGRKSESTCPRSRCPWSTIHHSIYIYINIYIYGMVYSSPWASAPRTCALTFSSF